jgi:hypothetical protein
VAVAGTAVAPTLAVPDNCKTVIIRNAGVGDGLYGIAAPGAAVLTENVNATRIPASASLTLDIGTFVDRGPIDQAQVAGSGFVFVGVGAATPVFALQYVCKLGSL